MGCIHVLIGGKDWDGRCSSLKLLRRYCFEPYKVLSGDYTTDRDGECLYVLKGYIIKRHFCILAWSWITVQSTEKIGKSVVLKVSVKIACCHMWGTI